MLFTFLLVSLFGFGIYMCKSFFVAVDEVTQKINTNWLRITLRIVLKIVLFSAVAIGIAATTLMLIAFNTKPAKKSRY